MFGQVRKWAQLDNGRERCQSELACGVVECSDCGGVNQSSF